MNETKLLTDCLMAINQVRDDHIEHMKETKPAMNSYAMGKMHGMNAIALLLDDMLQTLQAYKLTESTLIEETWENFLKSESTGF